MPRLSVAAAALLAVAVLQSTHLTAAQIMGRVTRGAIVDGKPAVAYWIDTGGTQRTLTFATAGKRAGPVAPMWVSDDIMFSIAW